MINALDTELNLVLVDLHGPDSRWYNPCNTSVEGLAEGVVLALDGLALHQFYIGGRSIGGMIAIEVGRVQPNRVKGIIPIEGWTHWSVQARAFDDLKSNMISAEKFAQEQEHLACVRSYYTKEEGEAFVKIWKRRDSYEFLSRTTIPILEIWGDRLRRGRTCGFLTGKTSNSCLSRMRITI